MRLQLTRIERLDKTHPGLAAAVCAALDAGEELTAVQELVREKTGQKFPLQTISNFKQERWLKSKRRIQAAKESTEATLQLLGEHGVTDIATAKIFEQFQSALQRGEQLALPAAARELRQLAELKARQSELEVVKGKLSEEQQARQREREGVRKVASEPIDKAEIQRRIRELYGLDDGPAPAVSAAVGEGQQPAQDRGEGPADGV